MEVLRALQNQQTKLFGTDEHGFESNPVIPEEEVQVFEEEFSIRLPSAYRGFITQVGNGGAGPSYGVFPLGYVDRGFGLRKWGANDDLVGNPAVPFAYEREWNDVTAMPPDDLAQVDQPEYDRRMDEFERTYWGTDVVNGAIPICHEGCAIRIWLVVTGSQAGKLWEDRRSEFNGLRPLLLSDGAQATFATWYTEWLDQAVAAATGQ